MDEKKAIEAGKENNELMQKIVGYLDSMGIHLEDSDFELYVNLIKGWEDDRNMSDE